MSDVIKTAVVAVTPVPVGPVVIPSVYRVFGSLPTKSLVPVEANAVTGVTWGAAGITALFIVVYGFCVLKSKCKLRADGQLLNAISTMIGLACIFFGFVSVGDSVQQYPDEVTIMGQISGTVCFMGTSLFSLCPLILKPFMKRDEENHGLGKKIRTPSKVVFIVALVSFVVTVALEIAVICLRRNTPKALLIVIFAFRLAVLAVMLSLGSYVLISGFKVESDVKTDKETTKKMRKLLRNKLALLTLGVAAVSTWTVCNAFESPYVLWMRGGETIALFVLMCVQLTSSVSVLHALDNVQEPNAPLLDGKDKEELGDGVVSGAQSAIRRSHSVSTVNV